MSEKEPTEEEIKAMEDAQAAFQAAMPPAGAPLMAARIGDNHICPMVDGIKPHVGGPITKGVVNVLIAGQPAATVTSICTCAGPPDSIVKGSSSVMIGGMPAARMLDQTAHGGVIVQGCPTVIIGG